MSFLNSIFGGGSQTTTTTQSMDPQSRMYQDYMRLYGQQSANRLNAGNPESYFPGYGQTLDRSVGAANQGMALGGLAGFGGIMGGMQTGLQGMGQYAGPWMDFLRQGMQPDLEYMQGLAVGRGKDAATQVGAYGGSRHGVAQARELEGVNRGYQSQMGQALFNSGLASQQFMGQERQRMANLGLGGLGSMYQGAGLGGQFADMQRQAAMQQAQSGVWRDRNALGMMQGAFGQPDMTMTNTQPGQGILPGILGLGATAASFLFPPAGAAAGALGGLGGLGGNQQQASQFGSQYAGNPYSGMSLGGQFGGGGYQFPNFQVIPPMSLSP